MIKDNIKIHDKFSLEVKSIYENISNSNKTIYDTITYFFIPSGLNINSQTYTTSKFYDDVKVYIRYNASDYTLDDIINLKSGPLKQLKKIVTKITSEKESKKNNIEFESRVKMLGAILKNSLSNETKLVKNEHKSSKTSLASEYLKKLDIVLSNYRAIFKIIMDSKVSDNSKLTIKYGDEYISNITNYNLIQLYEYYKKFKVGDEKLKEIVQFMKREQVHRKQQNYDVTTEDDYYDEILLYKRSQLKKFIEGVLFLNRDVRKDGAFVEQTIFAIAAGLAMVFSTGIAFYYQQVYGNFTLPFFIALVVGYMFKDRIKWSISLLFVSRASSFFYDYKVKIKDPENNIIGEIKENFTFVPFNKLGAKVKKHRFKNRLLDADYELNGERIIQYKKKIIINPKKFGKEISDNRLDSLADITRFNFSRFITQMDDPKKKYSLLKKGKIITRVGNKIYHINVIQKFYTEKGIEFKRFRVVMTRNGIKRIEKVTLDKLV